MGTDKKGKVKGVYLIEEMSLAEGKTRLLKKKRQLGVT